MTRVRESTTQMSRVRRIVPRHAAGQQQHSLLSQARSRFQESAAAAVQGCEFPPDMARTVLHSLELGFSQTLKEGGPAMQRQFDQDVASAVAWATEKLLESCRHMAGIVPGQRKTPLQNLALMEVRALEAMLPELPPAKTADPVRAGVPASCLRSFCALLNDGVDLAQKATVAAARLDQPAFRRNIERSQISLREAARLLRRMKREAGPEMNDLTDGLRGFQLELAAHAGSIRLFLKALQSLRAAAPAPARHNRAIGPHCLLGDLVPTLFHWQFEFTICTPHGISAARTQELLAAAHGLLWKKVERPVAMLLDNPGTLHPTEFKAAVERELQRALQEVNQVFAADHVSISISSNNARQIKRRTS